MIILTREDWDESWSRKYRLNPRVKQYILSNMEKVALVGFFVCPYKKKSVADLFYFQMSTFVLFFIQEAVICFVTFHLHRLRGCNEACSGCLT